MLGYYWGYTGIMEKNMETIGIIGIIQRLYWDNIGVILGLYRDNGKENGNYYSMLGVKLCWGWGPLSGRQYI